MAHRMATIVSLAAICLVGLSGCSMFSKKDAKSQSASTYQDPYTTSALSTSYNERPIDHTLASQTNMPANTQMIDYGSTEYPAADTTMVDNTESYGSRYHTIAKGETLYSLARRYYNDQARWKEIYGANRDNISNPNMIRVGQQLLIP